MAITKPNITLVINARSININSRVNYDAIIPLFFNGNSLTCDQYTRSFCSSLMLPRRNNADGDVSKKDMSLIRDLVYDYLQIQKRFPSRQIIDEQITAAFAVPNNMGAFSTYQKFKRISVFNPNSIGEFTAIYPDIFSPEETSELKVLDKLCCESARLEPIEDVAYLYSRQPLSAIKPLEHDVNTDINVPFEMNEAVSTRSLITMIKDSVKASSIIPLTLTANIVAIFIDGEEINLSDYDSLYESILNESSSDTLSIYNSLL
ncbi:hypothetical protein [Photobacterium damselae]|uniref:hypothetical protein n=1 Tax=Photobacterium damselae TaxID=38293 RepID=UPI004067BBFC